MRAVLACVLVVGNVVPLAAQDPVFSGPQVGEKLAPFKVLSVVGDNAGKEVDFVKQADGKPLMLVFVHQLTRPSAAVARTLASYADSRARDGLQSGIVWLTDDRAKTEEFLKTAKQSLALKGPVGISVDGIEGPGAYGLNRKVTLTILVAKDSKVTANFALVQPSVTDTPKIAEQLVKVVGGKAPTQADLEKLANPNRPAERKPQPKAENANRPGKPPQDPRLVELMRGVIRPQANADDVEKAVAAVEEYIASDKDKLKEKKLELGEASKFIRALGYGTEPAKKQLQTWAEKYGAPESRAKQEK